MNYSDSDEFIRHLDILAKGVISGIADVVPEPAMVFTLVPYILGKLCHAREVSTGDANIVQSLELVVTAYKLCGGHSSTDEDEDDE